MLHFIEWDVTKCLSVFIFTLVVCKYIYDWIKGWNYPPGPIGLPLIGYYPFLSRKPNIKLRDLAKKYGDVFSYYTGPKLMICVNDYHGIKEILSQSVTLSRPPAAFDIMPGKGGFGGMNGEDWLEQRRFVIQTMRNLGLGKGLWETMIQAHASDFVEELKRYNQQPVMYEEILAYSKVNNSLALLFGRELDPAAEKDDIETLREFGRKMMDNFGSENIIVNVPWITKVIQAINPPSFKDFMVIMKKFENIFRREIDYRMKSKEDRTKDDFIGCYMHEIEKRKDDINTSFTDENLLGNLFILFSAGQDSTVASVSWLLLLMAHNQDVQKKVCDEIDAVVGRDGVVYFDNKYKLPYCNATILEMFRWTSISAIFPPRYVVEDFTFRGYTIPQGAHVICNNWAMSHDTRYFDDPMSFKPERFLDKDGDKVSKIEGYGPFSFGKRNCPGEGIAFMTVFLYFVIIMQKLNVRPPKGQKVNVDYKYGSGILPIPQTLCFFER